MSVLLCASFNLLGALYVCYSFCVRVFCGLSFLYWFGCCVFVVLFELFFIVVLLLLCVTCVYAYIVVLVCVFVVVECAFGVLRV